MGIIYVRNRVRIEMSRSLPKYIEEQIPIHLSPTVKELIRRHLREEYLKNLEESHDEEKISKKISVMHILHKTLGPFFTSMSART